jgi:hypothetical protein
MKTLLRALQLVAALAVLLLGGRAFAQDGGCGEGLSAPTKVNCGTDGTKTSQTCVEGGNPDFYCAQTNYSCPNGAQWSTSNVACDDSCGEGNGCYGGGGGGCDSPACECDDGSCSRDCCTYVRRADGRSQRSFVGGSYHNGILYDEASLNFRNQRPARRSYTCDWAPINRQEVTP